MSLTTRIENTFSQTDFDNAMVALNVLTQVLSETKGLSTRAKSRLFRMGKANFGFVESAQRAIIALPELRPAFLDPADFERDIMLIKGSKALRLKLLEVASKIEDTELLMGDQAFQSALAVYRVVQSAYRMGFAGVKPYYEEMNSRWPNQGPNFGQENDDDPDNEGSEPNGGEALPMNTQSQGDGNDTQEGGTENRAA